MMRLEDRIRSNLKAAGDALVVPEPRRRPVTTTPPLWRRPMGIVAMAALVTVVLVALPVILVNPTAPGPEPTSPVATPPPATTAAPPTTTPAPSSTSPSTGSGLDLTGVRWLTELLTQGFEGITTDDGTELWETATFLGQKSLARDRLGGFAFLDDTGGLWWFEAGAGEPALVAEEIVDPLVEVIPTDNGPVARLGYGEWTHIRLTDGQTVDDPGNGTVSVEPEGAQLPEGREVWTAANGWSTQIEPPVFEEAEEGPPSVVEVPARLQVTDATGTMVVDIQIGTEAEPLVRIHDFDGRNLILSRGPVEPAMPEETFLVLDLSCASCTASFTGAAATATLPGGDAEWDGPLDFSEASLTPTSQSEAMPALADISTDSARYLLWAREGSVDEDPPTATIELWATSPDGSQQIDQVQVGETDAFFYNSVIDRGGVCSFFASDSEPDRVVVQMLLGPSLGCSQPFVFELRGDSLVEVEANAGEVSRLFVDAWRAGDESTMSGLATPDAVQSALGIAAPAEDSSPSCGAAAGSVYCTYDDTGESIVIRVQNTESPRTVVEVTTE